VKELVISVSVKSRVLAHAATMVTGASFLASIVSAAYVGQKHADVREKTCYWQLGEKVDAILRCTREVAVCEIRAHLEKQDVSDRAQRLRIQSCEHLVSASINLLAENVH
jgi:hypothetical protein